MKRDTTSRRRFRVAARHARLASQAIFLAAFVGLFAGLALTLLRGELASVLLALDPLTAVGTVLTDVHHSEDRYGQRYDRYYDPEPRDADR